MCEGVVHKSGTNPTYLRTIRGCARYDTSLLEDGGINVPMRRRQVWNKSNIAPPARVTPFIPGLNLPRLSHTTQYESVPECPWSRLAADSRRVRVVRRLASRRVDALTQRRGGSARGIVRAWRRLGTIGYFSHMVITADTGA
jgi:hypothetical protein